MTLPLHENKWVNVGIGLALLLGLVACMLYVAGYFYLWYIKADPMTAGPLTVVRYWMHYGHRADVRSALMVCVGISSALVFVPIIAIVIPKGRSLHGEARFANEKEIKDAGLLGDNGIILGAISSGFLGLRKKYLMLAGQLGVLLAAPPRSGKGAGFVNTNMLNWNDSAVVLDIRQESYRVTSGFRRKHGQEVYLFNPLATDGRTCQWNPLTYVSEQPALRVNDLQKIASMLFPDPENGDPIWASSSRTLFLGLGLYVFETDGLPRTIGEMLRQIMVGDDGESISEYWQKVIEQRNDAGKPLSSTCQNALYDFILTSPNTLTSIRKTFTSTLELWLNPIVDAATSADSFDLRDLRKRRISLYIGVAPMDLERLKVILNLLFQQILEANTREMPEDNPALKHQLLLMMDEFTAIGKVPILARSVSFLGGYNIRLCIVIQSPSQLRAEYGADIAETIMTCMGAQIVFAPRETKHAKEIAEDLGTFGMKAESKTRPSGISRSTGSVNESEQKRDLLLPQEVKAIGKLKEIIFLEDTRPILAHKIRYWKDAVFKARLTDPAAVRQISFNLAPPPPPRAKKEDKAKQGAKAAGGEVRGLDPAHEGKPWREMAPITVQDMDRVDNLNLKDFSGDFDSIEIPGEPITDAEMDKVVNDFLATIE